MIMGIVTAVGVPKLFTGIDSAKSRSVLSETVVFLRKARMDALANSATVKVTVNFESRTFSSSSGDEFEIPEELGISLRSEKDYLFAEAEESAFTFFPNGMASAGKIIVSRGDASYAIIFLDPLSGLANYTMNFED